jgi:mono/diheme cytochrome c family protein
MKILSSGLRVTKFVSGACLALALVPSFVSIGLGRGASPIPDAEYPNSSSALKPVQIAMESPREGGGARGGGSASRGAPRGAPQRGISHGGIIPPSARTTPRAHIPIRPEPESVGPRFGIPGGNFHGRDFARLNARELSTWRSGRWLHEEHAGFLGWWWVLGDEWYFYPEPIYPYPTYISDYLIPVPMPLSPQFRYYCDNPPGYYPDIQACYDGWQVVPIAPPPPLPAPSGAMANADIRDGFRIARDVCSACHVVQSGQPGGSVLLHPGPSFQEIANRPDTTADLLRAFINGTNWNMATRPITMPRQGLSERSTEQVVSYILSLKTPAPR